MNNRFTQSRITDLRLSIHSTAIGKPLQSINHTRHRGPGESASEIHPWGPPNVEVRVGVVCSLADPFVARVLAGLRVHIQTPDC